MKENKNTTCDPCQENFKEKVNELVHEGHKPSAASHERRGEEVRSAFGHHKPDEGHAMGYAAGHSAKHEAAKPAAAKHEMAKPAAKPTKR